MYYGPIKRLPHHMIILLFYQSYVSTISLIDMMIESIGDLNPLWIYCRDSVSDDVDFEKLFDENINKIHT